MRISCVYVLKHMQMQYAGVTMRKFVSAYNLPCMFFSLIVYSALVTALRSYVTLNMFVLNNNIDIGPHLTV